jgi:hypothetical protein
MKKVLFIGVLVAFSALTSHATLVPKYEPNDSSTSAMNLDSFFSLDYDVLIGDIANNNTSTTIPHASVSAVGSNPSSYDWYSFYATAGSTMILDADYGMNDLDPWYRLYSGAGAELASNDDSYLDDPGSIHGWDSFIQISAPYTGMYYLEVSQFVHSEIYDTQDYRLQVSVANHSTVPDGGTTLALLGMGSAALAGLRRKLRV